MGPAGHGDEDGVHDSRVACRRLREALAVAAEAGIETGRLDRRLRRLFRAMGPVRELDVARQVLDATAQLHAWPPAVVAELEATCANRRSRAARTLVAWIGRLDLRALLDAVDSVRASVEGEQTARVWTTALSGRVRSRAADLAAAIDRAGTLYVAGPLHEIRLAAKKLRYALELVPAGSGWRPGVARGRLRRAQTAFGALSDLQLTQREVQRVAARAGASRATRQALSAIDRDLEARCRATHADILRALPGLRAMAGRLARASALEAFELRAARMSPTAAARGTVTSRS